MGLRGALAPFFIACLAACINDNPPVPQVRNLQSAADDAQGLADRPVCPSCQPFPVFSILLEIIQIFETA